MVFKMLSIQTPKITNLQTKKEQKADMHALLLLFIQNYTSIDMFKALWNCFGSPFCQTFRLISIILRFVVIRIVVIIIITIIKIKFININSTIWLIPIRGEVLQILIWIRGHGIPNSKSSEIIIIIWRPSSFNGITIWHEEGIAVLIQIGICKHSWLLLLLLYWHRWNRWLSAKCTQLDDTIVVVELR